MTKTNDIAAIIGEDPRTTENMLEVALDSNFSSVMVTSALNGYEIKYVNPAFTELTGYAYEDVIGKDPGLLQGPKTDRSLLNELRERLKNEYPFHGKTINYRKDGSEFVMEWKIYPIKNSEGETTHYMAVQRAA
jgi:PAS domain S-box-containing protein